MADRCNSPRMCQRIISAKSGFQNSLRPVDEIQERRLFETAIKLSSWLPSQCCMASTGFYLRRGDHRPCGPPTYEVANDLARSPYHHAY